MIFLMITVFQALIIVPCSFSEIIKILLFEIELPGGINSRIPNTVLPVPVSAVCTAGKFRSFRIRGCQL